jgi:ABC-type polysaccharide/polyol phosphate export systems, permease component
MYLTPIFYPVSLLEDNAKWALKLNPMFYFIDYFRDIVLIGKIPGIKNNIICLFISIITLMIGLVFFYRKQDKFILYI